MDTTPRLLHARPFRRGFATAARVLLALALDVTVTSLAPAPTRISPAQDAR